MKKVYIEPRTRTFALELNQLLGKSLRRNFADSRQQRDDRFEDYDDYDEDENDFDNVAFWDD